MSGRPRRSALCTAASAAAAVAWAASPVQAQIRSFGEAEGFGATATGGRAGTIYHVSNLNDSGAGSFRDAVSASNRIIVFDVGGVINLQSAVSAKSNLTIAGQTAPGGGISLNGYELSFAGQSNVICRYLHLRPGDISPDTDDCLSLYNATNVIIDHTSMEFAKWNNIDAVTDNGGSPNVTIQNSIIADPIGQQFGAHLEAVNGSFTLTKNLFANSHNRNPLAKINEQFINNVNYNYEAAYTTHTSTPFEHDLVNNAFIYGPATGGNTYYQLSAGDTYYATGNVRDTDKDGTLDITGILNPTTGTIVSTPNFASTPDLPTLSVADAYAYVIAHAGASLTRDQLDALVISQVQTLGSGTSGKGVGSTGPTGGLYGSASSTGLSNGGLGTTAAGTRAASFDTDKDGIADSWEATHGMSSSDASDAYKLNPLGYLMIEQYINELGDVNTLRTYSATGGSLATAASWVGGTLPLVIDKIAITGTGAANGSATVNTGTFGVMKLDIGGNGPSAGETLNVSGGKLDVYDTMNVGTNNNATINVSGTGTLEAYNIIMGNTVFPSATSYIGTINLSGGTLAASSLVKGAGAPGAWTGGGGLNFTGGTFRALGNLNVNVPITVSGSGGTIDTAGFDGIVSGGISGAGAVTINGGGTLVLSAASTFGGGVRVNSSTLVLSSSTTAAGTGTISLNKSILNPTVSNITNPISVVSSSTLSAGGLTVGGAISGGSGVTLSVFTSTGGTSNMSFGGDISGFLGKFDFSDSTGNIRINQTGSSGADFVLGSQTTTLRTAFSGTVNLGSLSGGATTKLQGATNSSSGVTWVIGAKNASTTFSGTITDGTFSTPSPVSITKTGTGTLTFGNAASTYSGATTLKSGILSVGTLAIGGTASSIGFSSNAASNLVFDGGTLQYTGGATATDRGMTVTQSGGAIESNSTGNVDFNNAADIVMSGSGDRSVTLTGTSTSFNNFYGGITDPTNGKTGLVKDGVGTWRLFGNAKTYTGDTLIKAGTLYLPVTNLLPFGAGKGNVVISAGATLEMYGNSHSINGLYGAGTVTTNLNTVRTLTVGNGDADGDFAGVLTQGATRTLSLTKVGAGTQILSGVNLYTGNTTVSGGKLIVNGSVANSAVTVQNGATVGGNGLLKSLSANAGSFVAPGNGTVDSLEVAGAATLRGTLRIDMNGAGAGSCDLLNVAGTLDLAGSTLSLSLMTGGQSLNDPAYVLAHFGTLTGTFGANIVGLPTGYTINYAYNNGVDANNVAIVLAPEPAGLIGFLAIAWPLRRRRRSALPSSQPSR